MKAALIHVAVLAALTAAHPVTGLSYLTVTVVICSVLIWRNWELL